jgi:hypothetical protein
MAMKSTMMRAGFIDETLHAQAASRRRPQAGRG